MEIERTYEDWATFPMNSVRAGLLYPRESLTKFISRI